MELRKCECGALPRVFSTYYDGDGETWFLECVSCEDGFFTEDFDGEIAAIQAWNEGKVE